jgi:CYTH domain-containing protein/thymidylate kinase
MVAQEIERRFIIVPNHDALAVAKKTIIEQCYLSSDELSDTHVRVRITDGRIGSMTSKVGIGIERCEDSLALGLKEATWIMKLTQHKLKKIRHTIPDTKHGGVWEVDVFQGVYSGLVLAEKELKHRDDPAELPEGIGEIVKEVTDSLSNLHLALAAPEMECEDRTGKAMQLPERLPCVVLTGGPGSGKSTLMQMIAEKFEKRIHCVPETASILIGQVRVKPFGGDDRKAINFQIATARVQQQFERASHFEARVAQAKMLLLDRGIMDGAAYTPGGMFRFEQLLGTSRNAIYSRYDLVICLDMPDETTYERIMSTNPARYERYADGRKVGDRLSEVWSGHPNFLYLPHQGGEEGYGEKAAVAMNAVGQLIARL